MDASTTELSIQSREQLTAGQRNEGESKLCALTHALMTPAMSDISGVPIVLG